MSRRFEVWSYGSSTNHPSPPGSPRLSKSRRRGVAAMCRSSVQRLLPFFLRCRGSGTAASATDSVCLVRPCASMLIFRPADTSDTVCIAGFAMIVMAVLAGAQAAWRQRLQARDEREAVQGELKRSEQFGSAARDAVLLLVRLCRAHAWLAALCRRCEKWQRPLHYRPGCPCARRRYRRWRDASSWWRRRIRRESGGTRGRRRAPVAIRSVWWCVGPCERPSRRR